MKVDTGLRLTSRMLVQTLERIRSWPRNHDFGLEVENALFLAVIHWTTSIPRTRPSDKSLAGCLDYIVLQRIDLEAGNRLQGENSSVH